MMIKMKRTEIILPVLTCLALGVAGCKKEIKLADTEKGETSGLAETALMDSLETVYMMQSDQELMLADRIVSKNSGYVLDLSEQEATELQIPMELYNRYQEIVQKMNTSGNNITDAEN